ncbi:hypothetical protein GCM10027020_07690 [Nocardioides salsibiostraticola]
MTPRTLVASPFATTRFQSAAKPLALPTDVASASAPTPSAKRPCASCSASPSAVWHGQGWQLHLGQATGLPFAASLSTVRHLSRSEIENGMLTSLEPILATMARVLKQDADICDVEVMDSGPHAAHFKIMVMARPQHVGEGRLALLSEMLPEVDPSLLRERGLRVARALRASVDVAV